MYTAKTKIRNTLVTTRLLKKQRKLFLLQPFCQPDTELLCYQTFAAREFTQWYLIYIISITSLYFFYTVLFQISPNCLDVTEQLNDFFL